MAAGGVQAPISPEDTGFASSAKGLPPARDKNGERLQHAHQVGG